jgi:hypothetical protein
MGALSVFCRKKILINTERVIYRFQALLNRIENTEINPLLDKIQFDVQCQAPGMELYIKKILSLFPENSLKRGHCKTISVLPPAWFGKGSTPEAPIVVNHLAEAEDKYSLACGRTSYLLYPCKNPYEQKIELFLFPDYIDKRVAKVFLIYSVLHEYAHTLQRSSYFWLVYAMNCLHYAYPEKPTYILKIKGKDVDPKKWQDQFMLRALNYPPITTYSAIYENADVTLRNHEYVADYIATYLMGIAMNHKMPDRWGGLGDRPELKNKIQEFLEAEAIIEIV